MAWMPNQPPSHQCDEEQHIIERLTEEINHFELMK